ncbi:hypothetical protein REPUB_Repub09cG0060200 [Reevesia pubescens]
MGQCNGLSLGPSSKSRVPGIEIREPMVTNFFPLGKAVHASPAVMVDTSPTVLPQQHHPLIMGIDFVVVVNDNSGTDDEHTLESNSNVEAVSSEAVIEPRINGATANIVINRLRFDGVAKVDAQGFSRGPTSSVKDILWSYLTKFHAFDSLPWMHIGDFNQLFSGLEKQEGCLEPILSMKQFCEVIAQWDFVDLEAKGCRFTWTNN